MAKSKDLSHFDAEALYKKITSSRQAADAMFAAAPDEVARAFTGKSPCQAVSGAAKSNRKDGFQ